MRTMKTFTKDNVKKKTKNIINVLTNIIDGVKINTVFIE